MKVCVCSFSYKRGLPPDPGGNGGGFVFDCRALPNPFWEESLRDFTGRDKPVIDFFGRHREEVQAFLLPVRSLVQNSIRAYEHDGRDTLFVAFGCTGGRHRSVYCAESFAAFLRECEDVDVELVHTVIDS